MKKMNLIATSLTVAAITFAGAAAALELGLSLGVDGFVDEQGRRIRHRRRLGRQRPDAGPGRAFGRHGDRSGARPNPRR
jgi:hypothetical protein